MTRANTEQAKFVPWFAKAGAACSIVPIERFIGPNVFALKGGGYGCLFALTGIDEEGLTDQELEARMRSIEGALRGLPFAFRSPRDEIGYGLWLRDVDRMAALYFDNLRSGSFAGEFLDRPGGRDLDLAHQGLSL